MTRRERMLETFKGMAQYIEETFGLQYSAATVKRWAQSQGLPARRAGRRRFIAASTLHRWFEARLS